MAELAKIAGSMAFEAGARRLAQEHYVLTVQLAKVAGADSFAAVAIAAMAHQSYDAGESADGLELVQLAQHGTRRSGSPGLRATLAIREEWGYKQQGLTGEPDRACALVSDTMPLPDHRHPGRVARKLGDFDREASDTPTYLRFGRPGRAGVTPLRLAWSSTTHRTGRTPCGSASLDTPTSPRRPSPCPRGPDRGPRRHADAARRGYCLARGADQVFPRVVHDLGGQVEVVLPATDYRERKVKPENAIDVEELIGRTSTVHTLPFERSDREAYMAASEAVLNAVDRMVAVCDGQPSDG